MEAVIILGSLGLVFAVGLGLASQYFTVTVRKEVQEVTEALPGLNCGGCGYPNCSEMAEAMVDGKAPLDGCIQAGHETTLRIGEILGRDVGGAQVAVMKCIGGWEQAQSPYRYLGAQDCRVAVATGGGSKACPYGCVGLGTCVTVCPSNAITMGKNGIPIIDREKCTGCGVCVRTCPRHVIDLAPVEQEVVVACKNLDIGRLVRPVCSVGCIACKACERACKFDAIHVTNNLAEIDYEKCTNCRECALKCPTHSIVLHLKDADETTEAGKLLQTVG